MRDAHLVFVHGWGLGPSFWDRLRRKLPGLPSTALDLGFFGSPRLVFDPGHRPVVAVGHSLGVLRLLDRTPIPYQALVCLGGFAIYAARPGFDQGMPSAPIRAMRRGLARDPRAVLEAFHRLCGFVEPPVDPAQTPDAVRLAEGLDRLLTTDARDRLAGLGVPVLTLAARDDAVAPPELVRASFAGCGARIDWLPTGGHAFPVTRAEACARSLAAFVQELS